MNQAKDIERLKPAEERPGPHQVRVAEFGTRWRGLDPDEVYAYLRQVADEMDRLLRDAITAKTETQRLREGLRQWRARHVGCAFVDPAPAPPPASEPEAEPPALVPQRSARRNGGRW